jgi:hypothetical protein
VPPKEHRANAAERSIHTFKNHFISILCSVDSNFPMNEWDRLLPQTIITLNLLCSSRIHPSLSAHASLFGNYDFNRVPMADPGTKIVAHVAADARTTFGQHGKVGWYIGPSPELYRCYKCYFPDTMMERHVLKVDFFPDKISFPKFSQDDYLKKTAEDMLHLLTQSSSNNNTHPLAFGSPILNAFAKVATILGRATQPPPSPLPILNTNPTIHKTKSLLPLVSPPRVFHPPSSASLPRVPAESPSNHFHFAQSLQHDPTISGKMFNPTTGHAETIDSLLNGLDSVVWNNSLSNEWGRCAQGISKS